MRLLLTVQRHGIPPVQVLWTVIPTRPPLAAAGSSITVSQFLEQVNDIIPLESEDWGLEDYAVEVRGFECLHFSELGQILRDDDEVCIRPLQTTDLRVRKVSGRHQISGDGKHLIDGVAFGRPYLRRADRPAIRIPPRKRRRITYDEDEDEDDNESEEVRGRQIVLRTGFDDADEPAGNESDEEEDYLPDDGDNDGDEDVGAELEHLHDESQPGADESERVILRSHSKDPGGTRRKSTRSHRGLGLMGLLDENGQPFSGNYENPLLNKYGQDEPPRRGPRVRGKKRRTTDIAQNSVKNVENSLQGSPSDPERVSRRSPAVSNKSVRFEAAEPATPATVREFQDSDEEDDDFDPGKVDESDKENAEPRTEETDSSDESPSTSESSSMSSSEDSESDETSSSGSSSSDSSSDSDSDSDPEPERLTTKSSSQKLDNSKNSSSESSEDASNSKPDVTEQIRKLKNLRKKTQSQESRHVSLAPTSTQSVPPGQGKKKTVARNQRRKEQKALAYLKRQGVLPAQANIGDLRKYKERHGSQLRDLGEPGKRLQGDNTDLVNTLNAKRAALLTAVAGEGIDVTPATGAQGDQLVSNEVNHQLPVSQEVNIKSSKPQRRASEDGQTSNHAYMQDEQVTDETTDLASVKRPMENVVSDRGPGTIPTSTPQSVADQTVSLSSQHRRSKLDLSSAKRMLFGSLGLKTPKTKQDEWQTQEKLKEGVRPFKAPRAEEKIENLEDIAADDSWKDKVDLRAVECCHEGIQLSTPPFPFVQRWDPQQQRGYRSNNSQKRKGKKRKRNNTSYYEDSSYQDSQNKVTPYHEYESPQDISEPIGTDGNAAIQEKEILHEPYDQSLQDAQAVNEQLLRESGDASADTLQGHAESIAELLSVTEDPSECPSLTREAARESTIIAFKQLEMSAETNWQPKISEYRTAIVDEVKSDGILQMTLAKRDRPDRQLEYDKRTGERLYSKFEMPGFDDEDDAGKLEISFDELISPRLLRAAPDPSSQGDGQDIQIENTSVENASVANVKDTTKTPDGHRASLDGAVDDVIEPSEESREQISELIRDAGWRSSVQSEAKRDLIISKDSELQDKKDEQEDTTLIDAPSPRFNGFSSSPLVNVRSSPPVAEAQSAKHLHPSGTEIADSVPRPDPDAPSIASDTEPAVQYPSLPQVGDDSELLQEEAQHRSDPPFDHSSLSQDLISNGMDQSPAQSTRSQTKPSPKDSPPRPFGPSNKASESEDEFPEPFSQACETRMSQETDIKPEFSQESAISPPMYRRSKISSQRESNLSWKPDGKWSQREQGEEDEESTTSTPRPSQQQKSSNVVDLTIPSDSVDPSQYNGDDDDSYQLPKGPGWVKKMRTSKERSVPTKANVGKAKTKRK